MSYTQTAEFELSSQEYIDIIDEAASDYSEGELILINNCLGFCLTDVDYSVEATFAAVIKADRVEALKAAEAMSVGQKLYWDNSASKVTVTDTSAGLPPVGYVRKDAASGDSTVSMSFDGRGQSSLTVAA